MPIQASRHQSYAYLLICDHATCRLIKQRDQDQAGYGHWELLRTSLFWLIDDVFATLEPEASRAQGSRINQIMSDPQDTTSIPDKPLGSLTALERAIEE